MSIESELKLQVLHVSSDRNSWIRKQSSVHLTRLITTRTNYSAKLLHWVEPETPSPSLPPAALELSTLVNSYLVSGWLSRVQLFQQLGFRQRPQLPVVLAQLSLEDALQPFSLTFLVQSDQFDDQKTKKPMQILEQCSRLTVYNYDIRGSVVYICPYREESDDLYNLHRIME